MASASIGDGSKGRKKSLDAEINLVPFIDLLSMCICFLLMTAVWIQIGSLQVKQSHGTDAAAAPTNSFEMQLMLQSPSSLTVELKRAGKSVKKIELASMDKDFLSKVDAGIKSLLTITGGEAGVSSATLSPNASVSYGDLVSVMDVLRRNKIVNLGVTPTQSKKG
jgi:biopolymer transport protein TolR